MSDPVWPMRWMIRKTPFDVPVALRLYATTTITASALMLSACGDDGSGPSAAPSNAPPSSSTPSASSPQSKEPVTPYGLYAVNAALNKFYGSPDCTQVRWNDASCGKDLAIAAAIARATAQDIRKEFGAGKYPEIKKAADRVVEVAGTAKKLGCFDMGGSLPGGDQAAIKELCTTFGEAASLAWLSFTSAVGHP